MLNTSFRIEKVYNAIWRKLVNGEAKSVLHAAGWNDGMDSRWNSNNVGLQFPARPSLWLLPRSDGG